MVVGNERNLKTKPSTVRKVDRKLSVGILIWRRGGEVCYISGVWMVKGGSEVFDDGDGKVGEVGHLVLWRCPFSCMTFT